MEDNDLLMLAAKAAGLEAGVIHQRPHRKCAMGWTPWNPLLDDGDALRLAVKLRLDIYCHEAGALVNDERGNGCDESSQRDDPVAGARRAIVRAAAAMAGS